MMDLIEIMRTSYSVLDFVPTRQRWKASNCYYYRTQSSSNILQLDPISPLQKKTSSSTDLNKSLSRALSGIATHFNLFIISVCLPLVVLSQQCGSEVITQDNILTKVQVCHRKKKKCSSDLHLKLFSMIIYYTQVTSCKVFGGTLR